MQQTGGNHPDVVIVGAGISGLIVAYELLAKGRDVRLLESAPHPGGKIHTARQDGALLEYGPNSYRYDASLDALHQRLELQQHTVLKPIRDFDRYVYFESSLHRIPGGPFALAGTKLLPLSSKAGLLLEPFLRRYPREDESVASFMRRYLGRAVAERMIAPLISGIYAGDPERLSIRATFPELFRIARQHGSLIRGAVMMKLRRKRRRTRDVPTSKRPSCLCSYTQGLQQLPLAIAGQLSHHIQYGSRVTALHWMDPQHGHGHARWKIDVRLQQGTSHAMDADNVVLAVPAHTAGALLGPICKRGSAILQSIPYAQVVVVHVVLSQSQLQMSPAGFGFLTVPASDIRALGALWSSSIFPNRASHGDVLITMFYGGMLDACAFAMDDAALQQQAKQDLGRAMGFSGEFRQFRVTRHAKAIPQYAIDHLRKLETLTREMERFHSSLLLTGSYLAGISIPDCIRHAQTVAQSLQG